MRRFNDHGQRSIFDAQSDTDDPADDEALA